MEKMVTLEAAKIKYSNSEMTKLIFPLKGILSYLACLIVDKFHKWTTAE